MSLEIPRCDRSNAGKYNVKASNPFGEDSAQLNVIVLDAPTAPKGPLKVTDLLANQATLSWEPPEDECGAPVSDYVVEMLDPDTGEAATMNSKTVSQLYQCWCGKIALCRFKKIVEDI